MVNLKLTKSLIIIMLCCFILSTNGTWYLVLNKRHKNTRERFFTFRYFYTKIVECIFTHTHIYIGSTYIELD